MSEVAASWHGFDHTLFVGMLLKISFYSNKIWLIHPNSNQNEMIHNWRHLLFDCFLFSVLVFIVIPCIFILFSEYCFRYNTSHLLLRGDKTECQKRDQNVFITSNVIFSLVLTMETDYISFTCCFDEIRMCWRDDPTAISPIHSHTHIEIVWRGWWWWGGSRCYTTPIASI